jgi:hypothetical protein
VVLGYCWASRGSPPTVSVLAYEMDGKVLVDCEPTGGFDFIGVFVLEEAPERK